MTLTGGIVNTFPQKRSTSTVNIAYSAVMLGYNFLDQIITISNIPYIKCCYD